MGFEQDLNSWYAVADFLIHPAKYEPFGQIVTEALYMKTPVLLSDKVGVKELITKEKGVVLPEGDLDRWEEMVRRVEVDQFDFEEDFVAKYGLSLESHMQKMLSFKA